MVFTAIPKGGFTALMLAAREGALDAAARARSRRGANLDVTDPEGTTALVHRHHQRPLRPGRAADRQGREPEPGRHGGDGGAVRGRGHAHQAPMINRPLAKPSGKLRAMDVIARLLEHGADPEPGAQDAAADAAARVRRRRARRGRHAADARRQGGRRRADGAAARQGRRPEPRDEERHHRADGERQPSRAALSGPMAGTIAAASLLLDRGADVNAVNANGDTALHRRGEPRATSW